MRAPARERIEEIDARVAQLQELAAEIEPDAATLASLEQQAAHEVAALEQARNERALALAALGRQVASGNQELAQLKREEQAIESLVADLARCCRTSRSTPSRASSSCGAGCRGRWPAG